MRIRIAGLGIVASLLIAGCAPSFSESCAQSSSGDDDDDGAVDDNGNGNGNGNGHPEGDDDDDPPAATALEEADLYRIDGSTLYLYSYSKGLSVIDVSNPAAPTFLGQLDLQGPAGELYAYGGRVALLLDGSSQSCDLRIGPFGTSADSELVMVSTLPPTVTSRTCLAGTVVASRRVGDRIFFVNADDLLSKSWIFSVDVSDPEHPALVDLVEFYGAAHEIHVSEGLRLYVAQLFYGADFSPMTRVRLFDLSGEDGTIDELGALDLPGAPQGRFHMDEWNDFFRIVTYDDWDMTSSLHVIDVSDPREPSQKGSLTGIAPDERLYATRFDGETAYLVTFRETDPLWVVSLADPSAPAIVGELMVPGWSDYLFPRGDRLVAVGRGATGGVGLSLFDVSDPTAPSSLAQIEFGDWLSSSEATADFRGVTILDAGAVGASEVIVLPVNGSTPGADGSYECANTLHFVEIAGSTLGLRGSLTLPARARRSAPVDGTLYSISDLQVAAIDAGDLNAPEVVAALEVGAPSLLVDQCPWEGAWVGEDGDDWTGGSASECSSGCSVTATPGSSRAGLLAVLGAALLGLGVFRRTGG